MWILPVFVGLAVSLTLPDIRTHYFCEVFTAARSVAGAGGDLGGVPPGVGADEAGQVGVHVPGPQGPVGVRRGFDLRTPIEPVAPGPDATLRVALPDRDRLELHLEGPDGYMAPSGPYQAYMLVGGRMAPLPAGSTFDGQAGVFYWQPGPAFLGQYELVFVRPGPGPEPVLVRVQVTVGDDAPAPLPGRPESAVSPVPELPPVFEPRMEPLVDPAVELWSPPPMEPPVAQPPWAGGTSVSGTVPASSQPGQSTARGSAAAADSPSAPLAMEVPETWSAVPVAALPAAALRAAPLAAATPPEIAVDLAPEAGPDGWHEGDVTVVWSVGDAVSGIATTEGCDLTTIASPSQGAVLTCTATNAAGLTAARTVTIRRRDPPGPEPMPSRTVSIDGRPWLQLLPATITSRRL
jgi:hypothetical protein